MTTDARTRRPPHGRTHPGPARPRPHPRGRRARRPAEREVGRPHGDQGGVHPPPRRRGTHHHRGDQLRAPQVGAPTGRRRAAVPAAGRPGRPRSRSSCRTSAGLDRALALGARSVAVFVSATESFAKANLNRTVDEALAMFEPVVARAREQKVHVRGYLSMCFGDPWEGPSRRPGGPRREGAPGHGLRRAEPRRHDRCGDPGPCPRAARRAERGGRAHRPHRRALPRHVRPGALQHPRRPAARRDARWTPRRAASAAARTRRAPPATSPPKTSYGCSTASVSRPESISAVSPPPARGWPNNWADPAPPAPSVP